MQNDIYPLCPNCSNPIDPLHLDWTCPVCTGLNPNRSIFEVCQFCKFAPRLQICPHCNNLFEGILLLGSFTGKPKKLLLANDLLKYNSYKNILKDLDFRFSKNIIEDDLFSIGKEGMTSILNSEFLTPIIIKRFLLHTFFKNNNVYWLHCWGYTNPDWEKLEADIQVSVRYPSTKSEDIAEFFVIDVLI